MTFRERQNRIIKLFAALLVLAFVPSLMNLLYMGDFTAAGLTLYLLCILAVGIPAIRLAVQQVRAVHRSRAHPLR